MTVFNFKSGTQVTISNGMIHISRNNGKSAAKALLVGRTAGEMSIKLSSVTGVSYFADYLLIFGSGLPAPKDFKISSIVDVKQYPNCIVARNEELLPLYKFLTEEMA